MSIELDGLQVTGSDFALFDMFILGDGWSEVIPATSFSSQQTLVIDRFFDASYDPNVVGGTSLFLAMSYSNSASVDTLRMFEEDAGVTTDKFRIAVNYSNSIPEPGAIGFLAIATLFSISRRRR